MELKAEIRTAVGRSATNVWRKKGFVIGEVYGNGFENIHVAVPARDFAKAYKAAGETTVVILDAAGAKVSVLMQDVVRDSFSGVVEHADFRAVRMDQKLIAHVPVEFTGESPAVKAGGVLVKALSEIEVEALPADMPHAFAVDLSKLFKIGQSILVKDLPIDSKKAVIQADPEAVVATVAAQREEEVAEAPAMTMDDVKSETEEQKAAREKAKAEKEEEPAK
jgi:large subunit ribosomal protein L25